ncbi:MAG: MFS transporter [Christensenellales bacterium]
MKLTKLEKSWILYDVGNSAFILLVAAVVPIYFKNIAQGAGVSAANSTALWGYAASLVTVIVAILGPILGSIGDNQGYKKKLFLVFLMLGVAGCAALAIPFVWLAFLIVFILAKTGISGSLIFYDAMLTDITTYDRMDEVSSHGYAWGYIGSCVPFVLCLGLILTADATGIGTTTATLLSFLITAVWWALFALPLLKNYRQVYYIEKPKHYIKESFKRLGRTLKDIKGNAASFTFLVAFFLYIDGVYTIIDMATSYGKDVGISDTSLLLALLLTQVVAFPFAILFGRLAKRFKPHKLISFCIAGYFAIAVFALQLDQAWEFWFLAVCVAVFQGAIQALSRSYYAKIIPKEKSNEYFGLFDIFGKAAAFLGTGLMGLATQIFGHSRYGVGVIALLFILGFIAFRLHLKTLKKAGSEKA